MRGGGPGGELTMVSTFVFVEVSNEWLSLFDYQDTEVEQQWAQEIPREQGVLDSTGRNPILPCSVMNIELEGS